MSDDETMDAAVLEVARVLVAISETGLPERMRGTPDRQRELATWADALRPTLAALKARWQAKAWDEGYGEPRECCGDCPRGPVDACPFQAPNYGPANPYRADALGGEGDG